MSLEMQSMDRANGLGATAAQTARIGIVGVWLLFLYPILIWMILGTLTAQGFHDKIKSGANGQDNQVSLTSVTRAAESLRELRDRRRELAAESEKTVKESADRRRTTREALQGKIDQARAEMDAVWTEIVRAVRAAKRPVPDNVSISDIVNNNLDVDGISDLDAKYQEASRRYWSAEDQIRTQNNYESEISKAIEEYETGLKKLKDTEENILAGRLGELVSELEFLQAIRLEIFAKMPSQLLTLVLTLSMGALGSLIYITRDYFTSDTRHPFSWFLFRPFLGMVTAVAIFVLAKAGQVTISGGNLSDRLAEDLSPFFISFLAIISGLLSEQAAVRMRAAGEAVFRSNGMEDEEERWGRGLKDAMQQVGKTADDLAPYVETSVATVTDWIEERQMVPAAAQKIIAAWLNRPTRDIFTDIPPMRAADEQAV